MESKQNDEVKDLKFPHDKACTVYVSEADWLGKKKVYFPPHEATGVYKIIIYPSIKINIEINANVQIAENNIKYTLFSTDKERKYEKTLYLKDAVIENEHLAFLEFKDVDKKLSYSLDIEKDGLIDSVFDNIFYDDLIK